MSWRRVSALRSNPGFAVAERALASDHTSISPSSVINSHVLWIIPCRARYPTTRLNENCLLRRTAVLSAGLMTAVGQTDPSGKYSFQIAQSMGNVDSKSLPAPILILRENGTSQSCNTILATPDVGVP